MSAPPTSSSSPVDRCSRYPCPVGGDGPGARRCPGWRGLTRDVRLRVGAASGYGVQADARTRVRRRGCRTSARTCRCEVSGNAAFHPAGSTWRGPDSGPDHRAAHCMDAAARGIQRHPGWAAAILRCPAGCNAALQPTRTTRPPTPDGRRSPGATGPPWGRPRIPDGRCLIGYCRRVVRATTRDGACPTPGDPAPLSVAGRTRSCRCGWGGGVSARPANRTAGADMARMEPATRGVPPARCPEARGPRPKARRPLLQPAAGRVTRRYAPGAPPPVRPARKPSRNGRRGDAGAPGAWPGAL